MPTLRDTSIHHESDSEEDLDYIPECKEQGVINTLAHSQEIYRISYSDSDTSEERDSKRPRVESPLNAQDSAAATRYGVCFRVRDVPE